MKIYTKHGDTGETSLAGGKRVSKSDARVDTYGDVDELNAAIGVAAANTKNETIITILQSIQNDLFVLGAYLSGSKNEKITPAKVEANEKSIDALQSELPDLSEFILPGGSPCAAELHFARTVCRRAERKTVELAKDGWLDEVVIQYLNRLSDLLFVLARYANHAENVEEKKWDK